MQDVRKVSTLAGCQTLPRVIAFILCLETKQSRHLEGERGNTIPYLPPARP